MKALRVAIIGASGIGRNHVGWFLGHGSEVVAFVGSSPESISSTRSALKTAWNIEPNGYTSCEEMLICESPDAVCIACPPQFHFALAAQCLDFGAHVLCEKPLVGATNQSPRVLEKQCEILCKKARDWNLLLATQMQYAPLAKTILQMCGIENLNELDKLVFTMNTKNIKHNRRGADVWLDLSPHPLSVLRKIARQSQINAKSIRCEIEELQTVANFEMSFFDAHSEARRCKVEIRCGVDDTEDVPLRRWRINGVAVDYFARKNDSGEFCAYLSNKDRVLELPDFVGSLIGNFVRACNGVEKLWVSGDDGAQIVNWQYEILNHGRNK